MTSSEWDDDRLKRVSGDAQAHWVHDALPKAVFIRRNPRESAADVEEPLTVNRAIALTGGLYLIESDNEPDNWLMGDVDNDGVVHCWGKYGPLWDALIGL